MANRTAPNAKKLKNSTCDYSSSSEEYDELSSDDDEGHPQHSARQRPDSMGITLALGQISPRHSLLRKPGKRVNVKKGSKYCVELGRLQVELNKMQAWVVEKKQKVVVVFEGRDTAGKGGAIRVISDTLNPRVCRIVALPAPTEREQSQWYFQRYVAHLPAAGEIVLYDRSWYNRAGVERVMGFCDEAEYEAFMQEGPLFEKMLVDSGITLRKYWLDITQDVQDARLTRRLKDPTKHWKLSPMDLASREKWPEFTSARDRMFKDTHRPDNGAAWHVIDAKSKKLARLNLIQDLLTSLEYEVVEHELPERLTKQERYPEEDICQVSDPVDYELPARVFHKDADSEEEDNRLAHEKDWKDLTAEQQAAAEAIGYDCDSWDDDIEIPIERLNWRRVKPKKREHLKTLEYTRKAWDSV